MEALHNLFMAVSWVALGICALAVLVLLVAPLDLWFIPLKGAVLFASWVGLWMAVQPFHNFGPNGPFEQYLISGTTGWTWFTINVLSTFYTVYLFVRFHRAAKKVVKK